MIEHHKRELGLTQKRVNFLFFEEKGGRKRQNMEVRL